MCGDQSSPSGTGSGLVAVRISLDAATIHKQAFGGVESSFRQRPYVQTSRDISAGHTRMHQRQKTAEIASGLRNHMGINHGAFTMPQGLVETLRAKNQTSSEKILRDEFALVPRIDHSADRYRVCGE